MDRNRQTDTPAGLNFLMWPALVRAPWFLFQRDTSRDLGGRDRYGAQRKPYRY